MKRLPVVPRQGKQKKSLGKRRSADPRGGEKSCERRDRMITDLSE
jgi:hypothetical protein